MSIQEIIAEVVKIKNASRDLELKIDEASSQLFGQANYIQALIVGSNSGQIAVGAVVTAAEALRTASAAVSTLSVTSDKCIARLEE